MAIGSKTCPEGGKENPIIVFLLNLTGLGLGYLRLRQRRRWLFHLAITAGLLAAAFWANTCRAPLLWASILGLWWLWMAFDGRRLARRQIKDAPGRPLLIPSLQVATAAGTRSAAGIGRQETRPQAHC